MYIALTLFSLYCSAGLTPEITFYLPSISNKKAFFIQSFNHDFISIVEVNPFSLICEHFSSSDDVSALLSNTPHTFRRVKRARVSVSVSKRKSVCCVCERESKM